MVQQTQGEDCAFTFLGILRALSGSHKCSNFTSLGGLATMIGVAISLLILCKHNTCIVK